MAEYYSINFQLIHNYKYSLTEIENLIPWEREVYLSMVIKQLEEEKEKIENDQQSETQGDERSLYLLNGNPVIS